MVVGVKDVKWRVNVWVRLRVGYVSVKESLNVGRKVFEWVGRVMLAVLVWVKGVEGRIEKVVWLRGVWQKTF